MSKAAMPAKLDAIGTEVFPTPNQSTSCVCRSKSTIQKLMAKIKISLSIGCLPRSKKAGSKASDMGEMGFPPSYEEVMAKEVEMEKLVKVVEELGTWGF